MPTIFAADDSLGWTYQFWRAAEKKAVNDSQVKIGAAELPAVTQLFTEPYMVRFLLHNTLGAWWAGKVLAADPTWRGTRRTRLRCASACALPGYTWDYLRFVREDGRLAVRRQASFPAGRARAAEITLLDPCCGSGHFLTEALAALAALRGAEEGLSPADAVVAVLRDNLHGLEIDGRCVQIAAFALALTAWRIGGPATKLPTPHVAWVGAPPPLPKAEFAALAEWRRGIAARVGGAARSIRPGAAARQPDRGRPAAIWSSPTRIARIEESIGALVEKMRDAEPERAEGALAARGMADAAAILARQFRVAGDQCAVPWPRQASAKILANYLAARFESAKADLATAMLTRMRGLAATGGTVAAVTPQNWLFLGSYKKMREALLAGPCFVCCGAGGARLREFSGGRGVHCPGGADGGVSGRPTRCSLGWTRTTRLTRRARRRCWAAGELRVLGIPRNWQIPTLDCGPSNDGCLYYRHSPIAFRDFLQGYDPRFRRRHGKWNIVLSAVGSRTDTVEEPVHYGGRRAIVVAWERRAVSV